MNKTLYVTSFNKKLFDATGKAMIQSFLSSKIEGDLLVTHEDDIAKEIPKADTISLLKLEDYEFLNHWLRENKDIIPTEYGGEMEGCGCKDIPPNKHYYKDHIKRCPNLGFNRRASLWFRKIAAMHKALSVSKDKGYERIVFIDSDVVFKKTITDEFLDKIFKSAGFFFHLGIHRKRIGTGIESGFIGFSKNNQGFDFLQIVINSFITGDYRKYDRWDDGYVFRKIWEEHPEIPSKDVVGPHQLKPFSHVVRYGMFAPYLEHDKGSHTRRYKIFTDSTRI
jgi:hypothetical protein